MEFDVIVIGAGPVGAALALALREARVRVAVVEPRLPAPPAVDWDSRVYALSPGSTAWLERLGVWRRCDPLRIAAIEDMQVYGGNKGGDKSALAFSAYEAGLKALAYTVEAGRLQSALWSALNEASHVTLFAPAACRELKLEGRGRRLELEDGQVLSASLVAGADGAASWARAQAGLESEERDYHQCAVVTNFESDAAHHGVARQWFRDDGVLALLPLPEGRLSLVWSTGREHADTLVAQGPQALAAAVAQACGLESLRTISPVMSFPLRLQRLRHTVLPGFALLGDAAHQVHPLAGQGVNLGLRDARGLADTLAARHALQDCGDLALLRRYERARREDVAAMQFATDGLQRLFALPGGGAAFLRSAGLRGVDSQGWLKNLLTQRAAA